ncbi:MAG: GntR family transcriptional regulator [Bacteroidales bacterium]|nr:GntR family transcriptional regulator [Bacteroidales bacterium]
MKSKIKIDINSQIPLYKQLVRFFQDGVDTGEYKEGDFIPSMNELATELNISKETVKKAYSVLRKEEVIEASQGKGFYITARNRDKIKILLLFDKISTYKQDLFNSFAETIGDRAGITIHLHNQEIDLLEFFINENLDNFDYYIITPHFPLNPDIQKRVIKILKKIPNRKLILVDRFIEGLPGNFGSVYQDFENDIIDGLTQSIDLLKKYDRLNVISMAGSLYAPLIEKGIKQFCDINKMNINIIRQFNVGKIQKKDFFLTLNGQVDHDFIKLIKAAQAEGFKIGKDIGVIAYNESPINEIILNGLTVFSTDFKQMGELTAKMILEKSLRKIRCDFKLIKRNTFN